jgi:hypothetical protein
VGECSAWKALMTPAAPAEASAIVPTAVVATTPIAATPIAVVPGAGADKHAAHKPVGPVVAVRRAGVGVIIIIAVGTNWRWAYVSRAVVARAYTYAKIHSLGARKGSAKEANAEYCRKP